MKLRSGLTVPFGLSAGPVDFQPRSIREGFQMLGYIKQSAVVAFLACSMGFASQASALDISSTNYAGNINDGIPSNPANEVDYINTLILQAINTSNVVGTEQYFRSAIECSALGGCPEAELAGAIKDDTDPSTSVDVTGFEWLLGKYDATRAGSYVWYVGGLTGLVDIPASLGTCGSTGCGLSHWSLYNATPDETTVPEPGSLALLGIGLLGIAGLARRRKPEA
jgi:hypothetical protein